MLSEYTGIYQPYLSKIKSMDEHSTAEVFKHAKKSNQQFIVHAESQFIYDSNMNIELPRHLCVSTIKLLSMNMGSSYRFWVPLDRVIRVARSILGFHDKKVGSCLIKASIYKCMIMMMMDIGYKRCHQRY